MSRPFNLRNLLAIGAVAAIALGLAQSGSRRSAASTTSVDELNLRAETQVLESFFNDFVSYSKECGQLSKKSNLLGTEVDGVERKSQDLKQRLSNVQNAARSIMSKLKAANKWDNLNADILANTSDPRRRSFFQNINFKAEIEEAAATIGSRGKDIGVPVENLRRKVARQSLPANENVLMVRAAYAPAVPMANASLACLAGKLLMTAVEAVGKHPSNALLDFTSCACGPSCPGCDFGITGTPCSAFGFGAAT
jgi:hypothetical protein